MLTALFTMSWIFSIALAACFFLLTALNMINDIEEADLWYMRCCAIDLILKDGTRESKHKHVISYEDFIAEVYPILCKADPIWIAHLDYMIYTIFYGYRC